MGSPKIRVHLDRQGNIEISLAAHGCFAQFVSTQNCGGLEGEWHHHHGYHSYHMFSRDNLRMKPTFPVHVIWTSFLKFGHVQDYCCELWFLPHYCRVNFGG